MIIPTESCQSRCVPAVSGARYEGAWRRLQPFEMQSLLSQMSCGMMVLRLFSFARSAAFFSMS
jgi:hypothetical protein